MKERLPDLRTLDRALTRLRPLLLVAGLLTTPVPAKSETPSLHAEVPAATFTYDSHDTGWYDEGYTYAPSPGMRNFLREHPQGKRLLELESSIQETVKKLRQKAATCDEKRPDAWMKDIDNAMRTLQKLLDREAQYTNGINALGFDTTPDSATGDKLSRSGNGGGGDGGGGGDSGDGGGDGRVIDFNTIPTESYAQLEQEGDELLQDVRSYLSLVERDKDLQAALKYVFERTGCLVS